MWFVIAIYLLIVFALPIGIGAAISYRGLPHGRHCPHCGSDTLRLLAPALDRCSLVVPASLQRRWCMSCGWEGSVRMPRPVRGRPVPDMWSAAPERDAPERAAGRTGSPASDARGRAGADGRRAAPDAGSSAADATGPDANGPDAGAPAPATQTLDVRSLTLDGAPWRVMLQCWCNTGCFYGRFVFVAPSGRLWLDSIEAFSGASENEVLGQALSLPDGLLATRLRRLVDY